MSKPTKIVAAWSAAAVAIGAVAFNASGQNTRSVTPVQTPDVLVPTVSQDVPSSSTRSGEATKHYFLFMEGEPAAKIFAANQEAALSSGRFVAGARPEENRAQAERLAAQDAVNHARQLADKQQVLTRRLKAEFNAEIVYRAQTAVNGVAVLAKPSQVAEMGKLPGVVRVMEIDLVRESAVSSVNFVGTRNFWNTAGFLNARGEGVGVCVIDSGIDFVHTALGGPGGTQGYDLNCTTITGGTPNTTFPTSKVVWGYDLAGDAYNAAGAGAALIPVPDPNPMCVGPASFSGAQGHGAACASLIAGFGVNADGTTYTGPYNSTSPDISALRVSPGIAPLASLYAIRVFGNAGSSGLVGQALDITTALRIWQLSPDGTPLPPAISTLTGAAAPPRTPVVSVTSLSLGSSNGYYSPYDSSSVAAQNAAVAGLSVIISAGNAYDSHYIVGSPSVATATISVAATYNQQLPGATANAPVNGGQPALSNQGMLLGTAATGITVTPNSLAATDVIYSRDPLGDFQHTAGTTNAAILTAALRNFSGEPVSDASGAPLNPPGGNPYTGKIVLIDRGGVGFHQKALAAFRAGAAACVIVNNRPGAAPGMAAATGTPAIPVVGIPVVSINQDDGALLANSGVANGGPARPGAQLALNPENPAGADIIADYSSRGPRRFDNVLKPDMAAPAENVTVLQAGTGNQVMSFNGTSSACPHVAGAVALLRQITNSAGSNPAWTMQEIKALMLNMNQANPATAGNLYGLGRIGGGRLGLNPTGGVPTAVMYSTDADFPVHLSWGVVDVPADGSSTVNKTVRLVNKAPFTRSFNPSVVAINDMPGVKYEVIGDSGVGTAISVGPNATKDFTVRLAATGSALRHVREATVSAQQVFAINAPPVTPVALLPRSSLSEFGARLVLTENTALRPSAEGLPTSQNILALALHSLPRPTSALTVTPTSLALPTTTTTQNVTFGGNALFTGSNTNVVTNRIADIQNHAKLFELQYVKAVSTVTDPYFRRADIKEVGVTSDFARRANPFDTAASNNQSLVLTFAVTTHGDFNTPSASDVDVRILVDTNGDGTENFTVRSLAWNDPSYGTGTNGSNMFLCVTNPTGSTTLTTTGFFANVTSSTPANLLNNNVSMLSVNANRLGLTAGTSRFLYKVQTFWRGSLAAETPWISYDCARPGVDASGLAGTNEPFVYTPNGASVPLALNGPNFSANRSIGALAVFPHNAAGNRSQIIPAVAASRLFISGFSPGSGSPGTPVTITGSGFTGATAVSFGGVAATGFTVDGDSQITTTVPTGAQSGTIKVTTGAGTATSRSRFTVNVNN
ncbi:MAG: S8 family serine peptidase [Verrucomicrobia bacterium]|nr:S8 family serine peptidase [Verrucomicrobiota bacterium]